MTEEDLGIAHLVDVEVIGHGGFSWVYAATDTQLRRPVAVKLLDEIKEDVDKTRFDRECEILGKLSSHPNIVTVYSAGYTDRNRPYLIMELVSGGSLDDRLTAQGAMAWTDAVDIIQPVAAALQAAHDQGVLHRDVKPENILLQGRTPFLADFGIATLRDRAGATSTKVTASWLHAPPETFENLRDERSDLYSLASTLYAMIAGTAPFWRRNEDSLNPLVYRLMHEDPPPLDPTLAPPALIELLMAALAKDPDHRPPSINHFAARLAEIRPADPVLPAGATGDLPVRPTDGATRVVDPPPQPMAQLPVEPVGGAGPGPEAGPSGQSEIPADPGPGRSGPAISPQPVIAAAGSRPAVLATAAVLLVALVGAATYFLLARGEGTSEAGGLGSEQAASPLADFEPDSATITTAGSDDGPTDISVPSSGESDPGPTTTTTSATTTTLSLIADQARLLTGTWEGTYLCSQGVTGLTLSIDARIDGTVRAMFDFYAAPENPGIPSGSFTMDGNHTPGRLNLRPDEWLIRPGDFLLAALSANLGGENEPLSGLVQVSTGTCTVFSVGKIDNAVPSIP